MDEDLIDLFDSSSPSPPPPGGDRSSLNPGGGGDDDELSVDLVRLGSPVNDDDGGDDRRGAGGDKDLRRGRKKSPLQKILGAGNGRVLPSGGDERQSSSRRSQQHQQQNRQQRRRQSTTQRGRGRYGASPGNGQKQKDERRESNFGASPWAQMKKDVSRRSSEAGERLRRSLSRDKNRVSRAFDSNSDEDVADGWGDVGRGDTKRRRDIKGAGDSDGRQCADRLTQDRKVSGRRVLSHSLGSHVLDGSGSGRDDNKGHFGGDGVMPRRNSAHQLQQKQKGPSRARSDTHDMTRRGGSNPEHSDSHRKSSDYYLPKGKKGSSGDYPRKSLPRREIGAVDSDERQRTDRRASKTVGGTQGARRRMSEISRKEGDVSDRNRGAGCQAGRRESISGAGRRDAPRMKSKDMLSSPQQRDASKRSRGAGRQGGRRDSKSSRSGNDVVLRRKSKEVLDLLQKGIVADKSKGPGWQTAIGGSKPAGSGKDLQRRKSKDSINLLGQNYIADKAPGSQGARRDSKLGGSGHDVPRRKSKDSLDLLQHDVDAEKSKGSDRKTAGGESEMAGSNHSITRRKSKDTIDSLQKDGKLGGSGHEVPRRKSKDSLDLIQHDVDADTSKGSDRQTAGRESKLAGRNHDIARRKSKDRIGSLQEDDVDDKSKDSDGQNAHGDSKMGGSGHGVPRGKSGDTLDLLSHNVFADTSKESDQLTGQGGSKLEGNNHDIPRRKSKDRIGLDHQDDFSDKSNDSARQVAHRDSKLGDSDHEIPTRKSKNRLDLLQQDSAAESWNHRNHGKQIDSNDSNADNSGNEAQTRKSEVKDEYFSDHSQSQTSQPDGQAPDDDEGCSQLGDLLRNFWEEKKRLSMVLEGPDSLSASERSLSKQKDSSVQAKADELPRHRSNQDLEATSNRDPEREAQREIEAPGTPRRSSEPVLRHYPNEPVLPPKRENKESNERDGPSDLDQDSFSETDSHGKDDKEPTSLAIAYANKVRRLSSDQVLKSSINLITRMGTLANSVTDSLASSFTERLQKECEEEENDPVASAAVSPKGTAATSKTSTANIHKKNNQQGSPEQDSTERRAGRLSSSLSKGYSLVKRSSETVKKPKNRRSSNSLLIFEEDEMRGSSLWISDDEAIIVEDDYQPSFDDLEQKIEKNEDDLLSIKWVRDSFKKEKVAANTEKNARPKEPLEDNSAVASSRKKRRSRKGHRKGTSVTEDTSDVDGENSTLNSKGSVDVSKDSKISITIPRGSSDAESDEGMLMNYLRGEKSFDLRLTPIMMCILCFCYVVSLLVVGAIGFWLHMYATKRVWSSSSGNRSFGPENNDGMVTGMNQGIAQSPSPQPIGNGNDFDTKPGKLEIAPPSPTITPSTSIPTPLPPPTLLPSLIPSMMPSTSFPSHHPSQLPSATTQPSSSPTSIPGCPEQLLKSVSLSDDRLLTMRYDVVIYPAEADLNDVGGLLCVSLEYGGEAAWIGIAFSEASRDPKFGRKEAVIGIPGVSTSAAVATDGNAGLGQQIAASWSGPMFVNPGKYEIPAGGIEDGFYGPSLKLISDIEMQTLINGSISTNLFQEESDQLYTKMSFGKYLREPNNIDINPFGATLLLYAISTFDVSGGYDGNPEWKFIYLNFLDNDSDDSFGHVRKRRRHNSA